MPPTNTKHLFPKGFKRHQETHTFKGQEYRANPQGVLTLPEEATYCLTNTESVDKKDHGHLTAKRNTRHGADE